MESDRFDAIILGAGPAGITSALTLAKNNRKVVVFEKDAQIGGLSKTIDFKGFLFDMGPHRFFSKSNEVNDIWNKTLGKNFISVKRLTRIYYRNKFFDYPIKATNAFFGLGLFTSIAVFASFARSKFFPYEQEETFEQWVSNRFGKKLYNMFFKTYTEKLWGIPCNQIQAEWVAQRIKGLSLVSAVKNTLFPGKSGKIKTLIEQFNYPRLGAGMMYEAMARDAKKAGAQFFTKKAVTKISHNRSMIESVEIKDASGATETYAADYFLSSIPITQLLEQFSPRVPAEIISAVKNLHYRSTIIVNVIVGIKSIFPDNWIYVHSPEAVVGRIGNLKNWSSDMVPDPDKTTLGLEYFCTEGDTLWNKGEKELLRLAAKDLSILKLAKETDIKDGFVVKIAKTYPVYDRKYPQNYKVVVDYVKQFKNIQPIGRYGMFKYNNMDHSILTGLYAAENILGKNHDIWKVNADQEYHEENK